MVENEFVKLLDAKIAKTKELADEAQRWANRLGQLINDLQVLQRARDLMLGNELAEGQPPIVPVVIYPPPQAAKPPQPEPVDQTNAQPLSIGALVVNILTEAGKPVPLQTILERVHAKGRIEVSLKTLGGVISQYGAKGIVTRTGRALYALPVVARVNNGASAHDAH